MYRHILVATDGSALSRRAIRQGVSLAKALGARVAAIATSVVGGETAKVLTHSRIPVLVCR